jgi:hypothetical protein
MILIKRLRWSHKEQIKKIMKLNSQLIVSDLILNDKIYKKFN